MLQDLTARAREGDQAALHELQRCLDLSLKRIVRRAMRTNVPRSELIERIQAMLWDLGDPNEPQIAVNDEILTDMITQRLLENVLHHLRASRAMIEIVRNTVCFCSTLPLQIGDSAFISSSEEFLKR